MKVLLITNYFPPETGAAAHLYFELATELLRRGHEITVITGSPRYNVFVDRGARAGQKRQFLPGLMRSDVDIEMKGMRIVRRFVPDFGRDSKLLRGLEHLWVGYAFAGGAYVESHDVALVYSPPLTLSISAWWHRIRRRIPFVLNVQDLFPQSAIDLGVLRNRLIIKAFDWLERWAYLQASVVTVHSQGNADHVRCKSKGLAEVRVVPNWVNTDEIKPMPRDNEFRKRLGVSSNQLVVSFAGTLGYSQDLDVVLEAAAKMLADRRFRFVIVGDGVEKARLMEKARALGLSNVVFHPMVPKEKYPEVLAASDICLATLKPAVRTPVVPSKILSIMAAGRPVVAVMNRDGDAPRLIRRARCGVVVNAGRSEQLVSVLRVLADHSELRAKLGHNGRTWAVKEYSVAACASKYEAIFEEAIYLGRGRAK